MKFLRSQCIHNDSALHTQRLQALDSHRRPCCCEVTAPAAATLCRHRKRFTQMQPQVNGCDLTLTVFFLFVFVFL